MSVQKRFYDDDGVFLTLEPAESFMDIRVVDEQNLDSDGSPIEAVLRLGYDDLRELNNDISVILARRARVAE